MNTVLAVIGAGCVLTLLALGVGVLLVHRRRRLEPPEVSPDWINENVYGKKGDDGWK